MKVISDKHLTVTITVETRVGSRILVVALTSASSKFFEVLDDVL